ncbi:MAG: N-acetylmuramoyl-L-alanine amidase [Ignavibacteria bacterium]
MTARSAFLVAVLLAAGCETTRMQRPEYPPELHIVVREAWGWQPSDRSISEHDIDKITLHHGGEDVPPGKDPQEFLRDFQQWSRNEKHWVDLPYHFMIDMQGTIYEARPLSIPGDTNTGYDTRGHALICVIGNYEHQVVSAAQVDAIVRLMAFLAQRFDVRLEDIKAHKDYSETLCPGMNLYKLLQDGTIIDGVKRRLKHP